MAESVGNRRQLLLNMGTVDEAVAAALKPVNLAAGDLNGIRERLSDLMWDDAGVVRTAEGLERAIAGLDTLQDELQQTGISGDDLRFNLTWHDWLNLDNLITVSKAIAAAGLARENSRGAHYRDDFPEPGDLNTSRFTVVYNDAGKLKVEHEPVAFTLVAPGESLLEEAQE